MKPFLTAVLLLLASPLQATLPTAPPPTLKATAYILMDANTTTVLTEHNADAPYEPASLTKIMTVYLVFQALRDGFVTEQDLIPISTKARRAPGSRMFLEVGSQVPLIDVLRGVIVQSGNDASIALAEHLAGSEEAFVDMMNAQAEQLGLKQTHFTDASGLGGSDHYMSARDVALLSAAMVREFPELYALFREREYTWNNITQPNRNRLLWMDDSVDGIKTGFTEAAQYCLAASAQRADLDNMRLVSVVLGTKSTGARLRETRALLNWGFRFYRTQTVHAANTPLTEVPVWFSDDQTTAIGVARDLTLTLPVNQHRKLKTTYHLDEELRAPLTQGQEVGWIALRHDGRILAKAPALALDNVPEAGFFSRLVDHFYLWLN